MCNGMKPAVRGVGIDLCAIGRMEELLGNVRFLERFFTDEETAYVMARGKHMDFINNIDFVSAFCWRIFHFFANLTNIIDTIIGSCIDFNHIHRSLILNRFTHSTFATWTSIFWTQTIHRFCKDLCHRCFSGTSCSAKEIGMSNSSKLYLIF